MSRARVRKLHREFCTRRGNILTPEQIALIRAMPDRELHQRVDALEAGPMPSHIEAMGLRECARAYQVAIGNA